MIKIIIGTTPTIRYTFKIVDPADFTSAILTIIDRSGRKRLQKTLEEATVGADYIEWTLTQEETLQLGSDQSKMMLNWKTADGTRGASSEEQIIGVDNHVKVVI